MAVLFLISTGYAAIAIVLYCMICYAIIRHREFQTSYYKLFFVISIINVATYLNGLIMQRLPRNTCASLCPLSGFYGGEIFRGAEYMLLLISYLPSMQYSFSTIICTNRLMAVSMPEKYEKLWRKLFFPSVVFGIFIAVAPTTTSRFIANNGKVFVPVFFEHNNQLDYYYINSTYNIRYPLNGAIYALFFTILNLSINIWTIIKVVEFRKQLKWTTSPEVKLVIHSTIIFGGELFITLNSLLIYVITGNPWNEMLLALLPYSSDTITHLPAFSLLFCSSILRQHIQSRLIMSSGGAVTVVQPSITA